MNREMDLESNESTMQPRWSPANSATGAVAAAAMVNRTHRVVRERAKSMRARRSTMRSLWIPLTVSASMLAVLAVAVWTAFEEYEVSPAGLPDASQTLVLMGWSLPITGMVLAVVWFRRSNSRTDNERVK